MAAYVVDRSAEGATIRIASEQDELSALNRLADEVYNALVDRESPDLVVRCREDGRESPLVRVRVRFEVGKTEHCAPASR